MSVTLRTLLRPAWGIALCVLPLQSWGEPLAVGVLHLPPFYVLDAGETTVQGGIFVERLKMVLNRAKVDYEMSGFPPKRLYSNFAEGTVQILIGSAGNAVIEGKALVSPIPLGETLIELYSLLPASKIPASIAELEGKSVIVILGYSYAGILDALKGKNVEYLTAANHEAAFQMLGAGRAPYVLGYQGVGDPGIKAAGLTKVSSKVMKTINNYFQIQKDTSDAKEIMDKCTKALAELKAEKAF
jgi:polar amino acid transport system substrate-binding protein